MQQHSFGTTDLTVSQLCMGTMQFGWTADERSSFAVLDAFVDAGGNFLDTADVYSNWTPGNPGGVSEEILGRWLKERGNRDRMVIATKVRAKVWDGPDGEGLSRSHILRAAEESLRRLQIETIDHYQCHWPDEDTPIEETLAAFEELIDAGKVRYIGVSNYSPALLAEALRTADEKHLSRFVSFQPHYNLMNRSEFEGALADLCDSERLAVIPYSPLAGGFLTGKYQRGQPLPDSARAERTKRHMTVRGFRVVDALDAVARAQGMKPAAIAIAWLVHQPTVTAPIISANTPEQLADLLPGAELRLSPEEPGALNAASAAE